MFKKEVARLLAEQRRTRKPDLTQAQARLDTIEIEIGHIITAIKQGILTATTKGELERAEAERANLLQTMQGPYKMLDKVAALLPNIAERYKKIVDDLTIVTQHQVDKARGILKGLVGEQILLHPSTDGAECYLTAELLGDYSGLIALVDGPKLNLVAVTG